MPSAGSFCPSSDDERDPSAASLAGTGTDDLGLNIQDATLHSAHNVRSNGDEYPRAPEIPNPEVPMTNACDRKYFSGKYARWDLE